MQEEALAKVARADSCRFNLLDPTQHMFNFTVIEGVFSRQNQTQFVERRIKIVSRVQTADDGFDDHSFARTKAV